MLHCDKVGHVVLSDFAGRCYESDVVSIGMKLVDGSQYMSITCAVCDKLDNELLGADVVDKLNQRLMLDQSSKPVGICDVDVDTTTVTVLMCLRMM